MATTNKTSTRQGLGTPESAVGQGGKAGPQPSSSSDRSSSTVGNLAFEEFNATSQGFCKNNVNCFCIVCGLYTPKNKFKFSETLKTKYKSLFNIDTSSLNNSYTPNVICSKCRNILFGTRAQIFSAPMKWRNPSDHTSNCYFCLTNLKGYNRNNKNSVTYPCVESVTLPIYIETAPDNDDSRHSNAEHFEVSDDIEMHDESLDTSQDGESEAYNVSSGSEDEGMSEQTHFNQGDLSDLCRDLGLSKEGSELLASRLKGKNCLAPGTKVTYYRSREKPFKKYFTKSGNLIYCNDVSGLVKEYGIEYTASHWRLFIDSSKRSLKAILLFNGNTYAPLPLAHSVILKEEYFNLELVLEKLKYDSHKWELCGDLKIITIMLGLQSGFVSYPCFLCEWNSRARDKHYVVKVWPPRKNLIPGEKNVLAESLVPPHKVLLPPLHIKLGLAKQIVKVMSRNQSDAFMHIFEVLPKLSEAKINEGVFTGPDIRELFKNVEFERKMTDKEKAAWRSFKEVTKKFLGNNKDPNYKEIVAKMVNNFRELGCLMNLKVHFLDSHIDYFPENLGDFSEEQGERMHQDLKVFEQRYQGVWGTNMLADYCWSLKRDTNVNHKRKSIRRSFESQRKRARIDD